jgi:hypothetical protein
MAELCALLPAEGATLIKTVLDSLASTKTPGETRTTDQRRADALVEVFARVLGDPSLPNNTGTARPMGSPTIAVGRNCSRVRSISSPPGVRSQE